MDYGVVDGTMTQGEKNSAVFMESSSESQQIQQNVHQVFSVNAPFNSIKSQQQDGNQGAIKQRELDGVATIDMIGQTAATRYEDSEGLMKVDHVDNYKYALDHADDITDHNFHANNFGIEKSQEPGLQSDISIEHQITSMLKILDKRQQERIKIGLDLFVKLLLSEDALSLGCAQLGQVSNLENQSEFPFPPIISRSLTVLTQRDKAQNDYCKNQQSIVGLDNDGNQNPPTQIFKNHKTPPQPQYGLPLEYPNFTSTNFSQNVNKASNQMKVSSQTFSKMRKQNFRYSDFNQDKDIISQPQAQTTSKASMLPRDQPTARTDASVSSKNLGPNLSQQNTDPFSNDIFFKQSFDKVQQIHASKINNNFQNRPFNGPSIKEEAAGLDYDPFKFSVQSAHNAKESPQASIAPMKVMQNNIDTDYAPDQFSFHQLNHNQESIFSQSPPNQRSERSLVPVPNTSETEFMNISTQAQVAPAHFKQKNKYKTLKIDIKDFMHDKDAVEDVNDIVESKEKQEIQSLITQKHSQNRNGQIYAEQSSNIQKQQMNAYDHPRSKLIQHLSTLDSTQKVVQQPIISNQQIKTIKNIKSVTHSVQRESSENLNRHNRFQVDRKQQLKAIMQRRRRKQRMKELEINAREQDIQQFRQKIATELEEVLCRWSQDKQISFNAFQISLGEAIKGQISEKVDYIARKQFKVQEQRINDLSQIIQSQKFHLSKHLNQLELNNQSKIVPQTQRQNHVLPQKSASFPQASDEQITNYFSTIENERAQEKRDFNLRVENLIKESEERVMIEIQNIKQQNKVLGSGKNLLGSHNDNLEIVRQELLEVLASSQAPVIQRIAVFESQLDELNKLAIELLNQQVQHQCLHQKSSLKDQPDQLNILDKSINPKIERISCAPQQSKSKDLLQETFIAQLQDNSLANFVQNQRYNQSKSMNSPSRLQLIDSEPQINNNLEAFLDVKGYQIMESHNSGNLEKTQDFEYKNKNRYSLNQDQLDESLQKQQKSSQIKRPHRLSKGSGTYQNDLLKSQRSNLFLNQSIANTIHSQISKVSNTQNNSRHQLQLQQINQNYHSIPVQQDDDVNQSQMGVQRSVDQIPSSNKSLDQNNQQNQNNPEGILHAKIDFKDNNIIRSLQIEKPQFKIGQNTNKSQRSNPVSNNQLQIDLSQLAISPLKLKNKVNFNESQSFESESNLLNNQSDQISNGQYQNEIDKKVTGTITKLPLADMPERQLTIKMKLKELEARGPIKEFKVSKHLQDSELKERSSSADFKLRPSKNSRSLTQERLTQQVNRRLNLENQALMKDFQSNIKVLLQQNQNGLKDYNTSRQKTVMRTPTSQMPLKQRFQSIAFQKVHEHLQDHGLVGSKCPQLSRAKTQFFHNRLKNNATLQQDKSSEADDHGSVKHQGFIKSGMFLGP